MFELNGFVDLVLRFVCDIIAAFVIIRFIYYPRERKREYLFTFFLFNVLIFFVCSFLRVVIMDIGFAFGLFAIFAILRYRTETIPIREMTYHFAVITLGAVNGLANIDTWFLELLFINLTVPILAFFMESNRFMAEEFSQSVKYEKIELVKPARREELIADLRERTGLDIHRIRIEKIDFLHDTAKIVVYYREGGKEQNERKNNR